jgi:hypothetical protein
MGGYVCYSFSEATSLLTNTCDYNHVATYSLSKFSSYATELYLKLNGSYTPLMDQGPSTSAVIIALGLVNLRMAHYDAILHDRYGAMTRTRHSCLWLGSRAPGCRLDCYGTQTRLPVVGLSSTFVDSYGMSPATTHAPATDPVLYLAWILILSNKIGSSIIYISRLAMGFTRRSVVCWSSSIMSTTRDLGLYSEY